MASPRPAILAARTWLEDRMALPSGRVPPAELARLLRQQDREHLASARLLEENAEHARRRAQQARDLLARLVSEEGVSP